MKTILFLFFLLFSMTVSSQKSKTFKIEKLAGPEKILPTRLVDDIYESLILSDVDMTHYDIKKGVDFPFNIVATSKFSNNLVNYGYHSFFNGMYQAYADHRPFVLSPDMIWLLICQGVSQHINANPEKFRQHFVPFSGKLSLIVATDEIVLDNPDSPWEKIFPEFTKQIAEYTGYELINLLSSDYSTTTTVEKTASEITIMKAMEPYFEYIVPFYVVCGIPEITLMGTTKDWQKILDKTEQLEKYDLLWWVEELKPILEEFVKTSKGKISKEFWRNMFKQHSKDIPCGGPITIIDGWIVKFFPYDKKGEPNNLKKLYSSNNLPEEIVKVNLEYINLETGVNTLLELWSGFTGLEQNNKNFALMPKIGWMIRKKDIEQVGLKQKLESISKSQAGIAIKVKEIPKAILGLTEIKKLEIEFIDSIVIPDQLALIKIEELVLSGKIEVQEKERIIKKFPNTKITINTAIQ